MSRVLFTWELGGHLGHLGRHLPIARLLRLRGHEIMFAIRSQTGLAELLDAEDFRHVIAPKCFDSGAALRELVNYADILMVNGFGSTEQLSGLIDGWSAIFMEFRPDVVVSQFAPSSILAAKLARIRVLRVDCGFGCPPGDIPFPVFRPWLNVRRDVLLAREVFVLGHINSICAERCHPQFESVQEVFRGDADLLLTVPELDHFPARTGARYAGPIFDLGGGVHADWPDGHGPRIFVYLRPFNGLPAILDTLAAHGDCSVIAVLPGFRDESCFAPAAPSLQIFSAPVCLARLLPRTDLVISNAGHGLASACLITGVPMLSVPQVAEQLLTVFNLERLGIGTGVMHDEVTERFAPVFRKIMSDSTFRGNAKRIAGKYAGYDQNETIRKVCMTIEEQAGAF